MSTQTHYDTMHDLATSGDITETGLDGCDALELAGILKGVMAIQATARILGVSVTEEDLDVDPDRKPLSSWTRAALLGGIEVMSDALYSKSLALAKHLYSGNAKTSSSAGDGTR